MGIRSACPCFGIGVAGCAGHGAGAGCRHPPHPPRSVAVDHATQHPRGAHCVDPRQRAAGRHLRNARRAGQQWAHPSTYASGHAPFDRAPEYRTLAWARSSTRPRWSHLRPVAWPPRLAFLITWARDAKPLPKPDPTHWHESPRLRSMHDRRNPLILSTLCRWACSPGPAGIHDRPTWLLEVAGPGRTADPWATQEVSADYPALCVRIPCTQSC
jgi:hypothetical protein